MVLHLTAQLRSRLRGNLFLLHEVLERARPIVALCPSVRPIKYDTVFNVLSGTIFLGAVSRSLSLSVFSKQASSNLFFFVQA